MKETIIMMSSVTHAFKARDVLLKEGIRAVVIETPKELNKCGCGYSIKVREDPKKVKSILRANQIRFMGSV